MGGKRRWKVIWLPAVLAAAGAGVYLFFLSGAREEQAQRFRKMRVTRGEVSAAVTATGTINPVTTVLVGSQVSGTIKALYADFNSPVTEGAAVAQIDPSIFEAQVEQARANVQSAQAGIATAQANLQNAQANLVKAEVAVADARRTLHRNLELMGKGAVAQSAVDTAQTNHDSLVAQRDVAKAQIETAKAQLEQARAQAEQARAALKVAETNLRYTTIRSPVNGVVISRNVDVGQTVAASLQAPTLFTIAKDLTRMQVDTNVSEADIGSVKLGQEAVFTVDAYPERSFRGKISEIRNAPINVQNVVTYDVVVQVDNPELRLKPGMTANVSILLAHREGVLKVPNAALRFQPEESAREARPQAPAEAAASAAGGAQLERLHKALELTSEQRAQVEEILRASRGEFQALREAAKPEEARRRIQALLRQKLWGLLTEAQRARFEATVQGAGPGAQGSPGRVWISGQVGRPTPIPLLLGITDGSWSEVLTGDIQEGVEVIVDDLARKKAAGGGTGGAPPFMRGPGR
jgi:HlyD family secretion protein